MADIRELYSEARTVGFDQRVISQIIKMWGLDKVIFAEQDILLSTYRATMDLIEIKEKKGDL